MSKGPAGFETFFAAYINCALWASTQTDAEGNDLGNLDDYSIGDIDAKSLANLRATALDFFIGNREMFGLNYEQAGHDFWLTRNGHGAGFWDRGDFYKDVETGEDFGRKLTDAAHVYGECELWLGHDGEIYATEGE